MSVEDLAVYVHWPFCQSKCPYCDFNSHVRERIDQADWRAALCLAIDRQAGDLTGRRLGSVFFGGGTPSLMEPATVAAVLDRLGTHASFAENVEITLEANPSSAEAARFAGYALAGVNRLSLGVQALNDADLRFLGRRHDLAEALGAINMAARAFGRYSFDLIYARPGQDLDDWLKELDRALDLACDHISLYQLTIEEGTAFAPAHARGDFILPDDGAAGALFEATQAHLAARGLPAYEISNHARIGSESRHNLVYWLSGEWLGIGPGAHGRIGRGGARLATRQHRAPETWRADLLAGGDGMAEIETLTPTAIRDELVMMGLRLRDGVPHSRFNVRLGVGLDDCLPPARLGRLVSDGLLRRDGDRLSATPFGWQRLNAVLADLLD